MWESWTVDATEDDFASSVDETIARNVKLARERAGLSQVELAAQLTEAGIAGMHQTTIARIESGQRVLRLAEALALARFFEYQLEDWVESPASASLRSNSSYLRKGVSAFHEAANELNFRRWSSAEYLDREFPYTPDAHEVAVVKVDPRAFVGLDELLTTNSEPLVLVKTMYWGWLDRARKSPAVTPFVRGYAMDLYEELLLGGYGQPTVNDFSDLPDEDFQLAVVDRFADGSDREYQEASADAKVKLRAADGSTVVINQRLLEGLLREQLKNQGDDGEHPEAS